MQPRKKYYLNVCDHIKVSPLPIIMLVSFTLDTQHNHREENDQNDLFDDTSVSLLSSV